MIIMMFVMFINDYHADDDDYDHGHDGVYDYYDAFNYDYLYGYLLVIITKMKFSTFHLIIQSETFIQELKHVVGI